MHDVPGLNAPDAAGAALNVTEPCGKDPVPEPVSLTVAVHTEPWLSATVAGLHETAVDVERTLGVNVKFCVELVVLFTGTSALAGLKPVAEAVMRTVPLFPVKLTGSE